MALKLTILSEQRTPLGSRASIVFGVGGGSIGRAHDNDWVLPDPQRYLSAHHARVRFHDGAFHLLDTSTNGVFINDRSVALGRRSSYPLRDGDQLRLGEYRVAVSIDGDGPEAPEASAVFPVIPATRAGNGAAAEDLGADLDMGELLRPDSSASAANGPIDAAVGTGQLAQPAPPPLTEDPALLAFDQSERPPITSRLHLASSSLRALRAAERAGLDGAGIEAFCRAAGIDAKAFSGEAQSRALQLAGSLLREALVGIKGLALAQREMRTEHHIEVGREDPQQIGLTGLPVEDLLERLLAGHDAHTLDAVQWLRDTLASTRRHDVAMVRALRTALLEFVSRLDPVALAQNGASRPASAGAALLSERFHGIADMPAGKLPHLFAEAFARVFAEEFKGGHGSSS
jgi:type VI secretion system FHA domain protein